MPTNGESVADYAGKMCVRVCVCVCWYTMLPKSHTCAASKPGAALRPPVVIRHSRCNDPILSLLFRRRATQAFETMARCSVPCTAGTTRRHTMPTWWSSVPDPVDTSPPSKLPSSAWRWVQEGDASKSLMAPYLAEAKVATLISTLIHAHCDKVLGGIMTCGCYVWRMTIGPDGPQDVRCVYDARATLSSMLKVTYTHGALWTRWVKVWSVATWCGEGP